MRQTGRRGKWRGASLRQHMGRANSNGRRGRWRERPRWGILSWRCSCDAGPEGSTPCLLCTAASLVPSKEAFSQSLPTWMSQDFRSSACSTEQLCVPSYFLDGRKQDESCTEGLRQAGQSRQGQWKGRRRRGGSEVWEEKLPGAAGTILGGGRCSAARGSRPLRQAQTAGRLAEALVCWSQAVSAGACAGDAGDDWEDAAATRGRFWENRWQQDTLKKAKLGSGRPVPREIQGQSWSGHQ